MVHFSSYLFRSTIRALRIHQKRRIEKESDTHTSLGLSWRTSVCVCVSPLLVTRFSLLCLCEVAWFCLQFLMATSIVRSDKNFWLVESISPSQINMVSVEKVHFSSVSKFQKVRLSVTLEDAVAPLFSSRRSVLSLLCLCAVCVPCSLWSILTCCCLISTMCTGGYLGVGWLWTNTCSRWEDPVYRMYNVSVFTSFCSRFPIFLAFFCFRFFGGLGGGKGGGTVFSLLVYSLIISEWIFPSVQLPRVVEQGRKSVSQDLDLKRYNFMFLPTFMYPYFF